MEEEERNFHSGGDRDVSRRLTGLFALPFIGESHRVEFRSDLFNAFNHTQWANSDRTMTSTTYGRITATRPARQIQFALRYIF